MNIVEKFIGKLEPIKIIRSMTYQTSIEEIEYAFNKMKNNR